MTLNKNIILRKTIYLIVDLVLISGSFLFFIWIKPGTKSYYLPTYYQPYIFFSIVWVLVSLFIGKYNFHKARKAGDVIVPILITNTTAFLVIVSLIYYFNAFSFSRLIIYGTILLLTVLELITSYLYYSYKTPVVILDPDDYGRREVVFDERVIHIEHPEEDQVYFDRRRENIRKTIVQETSEDVFSFIQSHIDVAYQENAVISTTTLFNIENLGETFLSITNLHRVNDIRRINKFFEAVNAKLPFGGIFIGNAETFMQRKERILGNLPPVINRIYYFFDFIFTRVLPKLPMTKKLYFFITLGQNRVLSRAETLGRLYSCGFEVIEEKLIDNLVFFAVRKVKKPAFDNNPTYGPFIKLRRLGKDGKVIGVYKLRTMHPYSEYLQEYIYAKNNLEEGGKFSNDFRVNAPGRFMRKFWIDELPMFINVFKGEMKIVGVRPLSKHYFELYSPELRQKRLRYKPGLVPPFYADMPKSLEEIMISENKYLDEYEKKPFLTDLKYFITALYNIIFRRARSK